jgi:hypothetical protein
VNAYTVSAWFNPDSISGTRTIFSTKDASGWRFILRNDGSNLTAYHRTTGNSYVTTETGANTVQTGVWQHALVTWDGATMRIYLNGALKQESAVTQINDWSNSAAIGRQVHDGTEYFDGKIDEVKVYPAALTEDQIATEINLGKSMSVGSKGPHSNTNPSNASSRDYCVPGENSTCNSPIVEWKLDEGPGTSSIYDTSGNNYYATFQGTVLNSDWVPGKVGKAFAFNGSNSYTTAGDINALEGIDKLTISLWIKPLSLATDKTIISKFGNNTEGGWALQTSSDANGGSNDIFITARAGGGSNAYSNTTSDIFVINQWTHLEVVYDGTQATNATKMKIYVNGINKPLTYYENVPSSLPINNRDVQLAYHEWAGFGNFVLDNVRIYNYARTATQAAWDYNNGLPMTVFRMDECSGVTLHDTSENKFTAALSIGGTEPQTTAGSCESTTGTEAWNNGTSGKISSALSLDGIDDHAYITDDDKFSFTNGTSDTPFSIAGWLYIPTGATAERAILTKYRTDGESQREWLFRVGNYPNNTDNRLDIELWDNTNGGKLYAYSNTDLPRDTWVHATVVYDGSASTNGIKIYLNGVETSTTKNSSGTYVSMKNTTSNIKIGAMQETPVQLFNGKIDELRVYTYALTSEQIKTIFNNGPVNFQN